MTKVTVLVAVYNAQRFLHQCLDSLLNQTLRDVQIVCIDDCSTDGSLTLLNGYAAEDSRVEVIALPENRGQAHARNEGLKIARGKYVCFVDIDDWLAPDALERCAELLECQPCADCVLFRVVETDETGNKELRQYPLPQVERLTGNQAFELSLDWTIHGVYMVRKELHQAYPYDESLRAFGDDNTTRIHYLKSREVLFSQGTYYYRQHPDSTTHQISERYFDHILANEKMKSQLLQQGCSSHVLDIYENVRWLNLVDAYMFYFKNRRTLSPTGRNYGLQAMERVFSGLEPSRLQLRNKLKFGYIPFFAGRRNGFVRRLGWNLFRLQEEVYFSLRSVLSIIPCFMFFFII